MPNKLFEKVCVVCEAKASGFNFNAITCESCKAFFRRNSLKNKKFKCFSIDDCKISRSNRKWCKKCRLKKCFDQGMRTDLILTEEEKELRRIKINENKNKFQKITKDSELNEQIEWALNEDLDLNSSYSEDVFTTNQCNEITTNSDSQQTMEMEIYYPNNSTSDLVSDDISQTLSATELSLVPIERPINDCNNYFNELEINKLRELQNAIQLLRTQDIRLFDPLDSFVVKEYWQALNAMCHKADYDIRKIVKMSKCLNAFRSLCADDQIVLLKYGSIEIICLRVILNYNFDYDYWHILTNSGKSIILFSEMLRYSKRSIHINEKNFLMNMKPEWDSDFIIIDLLTAITLFDPNRPQLKHREHINLQRHIYMHLLQRYLQMRYQSECKSKAKFLRLINNLSELHILNDKISMNWCERESQTFPLLKEIANRDELPIDTSDNQHTIE